MSLPNVRSMTLCKEYLINGIFNNSLKHYMLVKYSTMQAHDVISYRVLLNIHVSVTHMVLLVSCTIQKQQGLTFYLPTLEMHFTYSTYLYSRMSMFLTFSFKPKTLYCSNIPQFEAAERHIKASCKYILSIRWKYHVTYASVCIAVSIDHRLQLLLYDNNKRQIYHSKNNLLHIKKNYLKQNWQMTCYNTIYSLCSAFVDAPISNTINSVLPDIFHVNLGVPVSTQFSCSTCSGREPLRISGRSFSMAWMPFLWPNQQCKTREGNSKY